MPVAATAADSFDRQKHSVVFGGFNLHRCGPISVHWWLQTRVRGPQPCTGPSLFCNVKGIEANMPKIVVIQNKTTDLSVGPYI